jgi:hypothetical protein
MPESIPAIDFFNKKSGAKKPLFFPVCPPEARRENPPRIILHF